MCTQRTGGNRGWSARPIGSCLPAGARFAVAVEQPQPRTGFLGFISLLCGLLIVGAHVLTLNRIRENQQEMLRESLVQLMPGMARQAVYVVEPNGEIGLAEGIVEGRKKIYAGFDANGKFMGVVLEGSERGYGDVITAMFAYSPETKTITGFTVLEMRETPGLGAKIGNDPEFLSNFKALDTSEPIETVKHGTKKKASQIDAISGATISSRAVGRLIEKAVREMHPVLERHRDRIQRGN